MKEMTQAIIEVKARVSREEWERRIIECQESGKSVRKWCEENGVTTGSYYHHLRKIRESMLEEKQIVPLAQTYRTERDDIKIEVGEMTISIPEGVSAEMVSVIIGALKSC